MKTLSSLTSTMLPPKEAQGKVVEFIAVLGGFKNINPSNSNELKCPICEKKEHYTPFVDPSKDSRRAWVCAAGDCATNQQRISFQATLPTPKAQRALEWPLFCELNGIGDLDHDVKFDHVDQSPAKRDFLLKFAAKPCGVILMQGGSGPGKTYASMGVCELFTRKNTSCIFSTQKQMFSNWLEHTRGDKVNNYIHRIININLLVVDDFGTADISPGFMSFFLDLMNTRLRWSDRGTIITTNLDDKKFSEYCGEALNDRIQTGQKFVFENKTRRKPIIL